MSLATRCSACGTIFRVVQDQLRVSDGWVRCGRCDSVFDAASSLFDLEQEAPPDWQPTEPPAMDPEPAEAAIERGGPFASDDERRWSASMAAQGMADRAGLPASGEPLPAPASPTAAAALAQAADDEPPARLLVRNSEEDAGGGVSHPAEEDEADGDIIVITDHPSTGQSLAGQSSYPAKAVGLHSASDRGPDADAGADADAYADDQASAADMPAHFLRRAGRRTLWQSSRARTLLGTLAMVLLLTLALQAAQQFSELTAARWPVLRPALAAWCDVSGCSVAPPHRIDDLVVESTSLSPTTSASGASPSGLRLAVTLRNRAAYAVALPSIDLSLTDTNGTLVARRALSPADFLQPVPSVAAGADLPLQAVLTAAGGGAPRVAGYTVEIFYP